MAGEFAPDSQFRPRAQQGRPKPADASAEHEDGNTTAEYQAAWAYRWEDTVNGSMPATSPPLCEQILEELQTLGAQSSPHAPLILIRGEMGIGKSVLAEQILDGCSRISRSSDVDLSLVQVLEAEDLESPHESQAVLMRPLPVSIRNPRLFLAGRKPSITR